MEKHRANCTLKEFEDALFFVLGEAVYKTIGNIAILQTHAIIKIFMEELEQSSLYEKECRIIREGAYSLQINGYYLFKE